jgi:hypothetical protein
MSRILLVTLLIVVQLKPVYYSLLSLRLPGTFYLSWFTLGFDLLVLFSFIATVAGVIHLIRKRLKHWGSFLRFAIYFNFFYLITFYLTVIAIEKECSYAAGTFVVSQVVQIAFIVVTAVHFITHRGEANGTQRSSLKHRVVVGLIDFLIVLSCSVNSYTILAASGWIFGDFTTIRLWIFPVLFFLVYYCTLRIVFRQTVGQLCFEPIHG